MLRPAGRQPDLPVLTADSSLADYLRFALLNHPQVAAAFYDWRAAVEAITPARSLPDPQFTFQADIADTVMTFMPGIMFDFMTRGKRAAMGREAAAASEVAYRTYAATVLRTAATVRKAWIELAYVDEALRLREGSLGAIDQSAAVSAAEYSTGRGMASLETQVLFLNSNRAIARHDRRARRSPRRGARPLQIGPRPFARRRRSAVAAHCAHGNSAAARAGALARGPSGQSRARLDARHGRDGHCRRPGRQQNRHARFRARRDDRPQGRSRSWCARPANLTLPIWRDKIAATIAAAEARRDAAVARLNAEQLNLAAELAQMLYMVRESERMISYLEGTALPNLERSLASAEAAYQSGMGGPGMIPQTRLMALGMRLERLDALRQRENRRHRSPAR